MFDAIKSLSPKQRFLGFVIVVIISAITSLGTAYMSGSDCTEVSEKYTKSIENYTKSIENYNKLVEITDQTQQKYLKAREDILLIQDKLNQLSEMMNKKSIKESDTEYTKSKMSYNRSPASVQPDTVINISTPNEVIIKEKTIVTKIEAPKGAKIMVDSLLKITKKYDKK